jgi:hypothetical protein
MTNDITPAKKLLDNVDYNTLNVLGILHNVTKGLRKIHTTFGGFGLFDLPTEQLISRVNMFFQPIPCVDKPQQEAGYVVGIPATADRNT